MGSHKKIIQSNLKIDAENIPAAIASLRQNIATWQYYDEEAKQCLAIQDDPQFLEKLGEIDQLYISIKEDGSIQDPSNREFFDGRVRIFDAMAPWIKSGSYFEIQDDDDQQVYRFIWENGNKYKTILPQWPTTMEYIGCYIIEDVIHSEDMARKIRILTAASPEDALSSLACDAIEETFKRVSSRQPLYDFSVEVYVQSVNDGEMSLNREYLPPEREGGNWIKKPVPPSYREASYDWNYAILSEQIDQLASEIKFTDELRELARRAIEVSQ